MYRPRPTRFPQRRTPLITCLWLGASLTRDSRDSVMARRVIASRSQTVSYCFVGRLRYAVTAVLIPYPQKHPDSEQHSNTAGMVTF